MDSGCQHHSHVEEGGPALIDAARGALESAGEQWTEMRATIFETLADYDTPASAYDIAERVSQRRGRRVAPNSVYRILDLFVATNIAMRVESANAYVANSHPGCLHDCIFLVCNNCGQVSHADDDRVAGLLRELAAKEGFIPDRLVIEARGRCARCAAESGAA